jgi:large subunit ribosomal protein L25
LRDNASEGKLSLLFSNFFTLNIMDTVLMDAKLRDPKLSSNTLRRNKQIPGVFYGKGKESLALQVEYQVFRKAFIKGGYSQILDLDVEGKKFKVLVHDVQFDPITGAITHVDFLNINLKEEITTDVPVEVKGIAPAVKDHGGILTTVKRELTVRCLPMDLPHSIVVDVSGLLEFSQAIHVKDIELPKGVVITDEADDVVITVSAPKEEEVEAVAAPATGIEGTAAAVEAAKAATAEAEKKEEKKE